MTTGSTDIARTRQGIYRFLGGALLPPDAKQFDLLAGAVEVMNDRDIDQFAFGPAWRRLGRHFPIDVAADGLDVGYVQLFASGIAGRVSPPTESHYRVVMRGGEIAEFVAGLQGEYRSMGIASVGEEEAPDHISTELEVMSHLCDREASAWGDDQIEGVKEVLDLESQFLHQHLTVWIPPFHDLVHACDPLPFYLDLVDMVHAFVVHERDYVNLIRRGMVE